MGRWRLNAGLALAAMAAMIGALGCGSSKSSGVSLTISPTVASVITNRTQQFSGLVTGSTNTSITWTLACETGVSPANTCGSIDAAGLYTAPGTIPTIPATSSTTTPTPAPTVTITGTAQADTSKAATATLTIVTGISISITPTSATVGTTEHLLFTANVSNPGCNSTSNAKCTAVTWTVPTSTTTPNPNGAIDTNGVYTAPAQVPNPSTVIITATSQSDTSVTATATVTVVTAVPPTVTQVSPNTAPIGGLFQDIYITGTNFISTNVVYVNHAPLSSTLITQVSSSLIRARIPDSTLAAPPSSGFLVIGISEQAGAEQACTGTDPSQCQVSLVNARPGVVGPSPDRIPQGTAGVQTFSVDGGFFGTGSNPAAPAVIATYNGQLRGAELPASGSIGSTRQLSVLIGGGGSNSSDFTIPGLYPVAIENVRDTSKFAVTNLAVQPNYNGGSTITQIPSNTNIPVGTSPSSVAINAATGVAVVANTGSNDITLLSFDPIAGPPAVIGSICTYAVGLAEPCPTSTPSGPTSVAVDDVRNEALVTNALSNSVAVVDLNTKVVTAVITLQDPPQAVGVNPVTGRALVAMQGKNYGVLVDLTVNPPVAAGIVSISTGTNTQVAVEPRLNWAVVSPGGAAASLAIVDLSSQGNNAITEVSRTTNVVTVTVASTAGSPPLAVAQGDTVQISNVQFPAGTAGPIAALAPTFNGFYTVSSVGPGPDQFSYAQTNGTQTDVATQSTPQDATGSVSTSEPVAIETAPIDSQGIAVNPETQQAVLVDPTTGGVVTFFSLIDQSESSLNLTSKGNNSTTHPDTGTNAVAYNALTDTIVAVNSITDEVSVIDPVAPIRLNDNNVFQLSCTSTSSKTCGPSAVAVDAGTNIAVIANQTDNSVSVLSLGPIQRFSISDSSPKTYITTSTLQTAPSPAPQTITVIGTGFGPACVGNATSLQVRLDGVALSTSCSAAQANRVLTATVPSSMLLKAHRYALDVLNPSNSQATNAEDFTVEQSVDVSTACTVPPEPVGVAIDPVQNLVAVSLFGCNDLALINLDSASGSVVSLGGTASPIGVAVLPRLHLAVVANNGNGTASIIDEKQGKSLQTVGVGSGPIGAGADEATGQVAIANSIGNTVSVVNASTGGVSTISTGQRPVAVAMNYINNQVAGAASTSNLLSVSAGTTGTAAQSFSVSGPSSVVYDPVPSDCGSNNTNGTTTNSTGCFIVSASLSNLVEIIDPVTSIQNSFRVGINPGSIAYNYFNGTLVSTNTASHTITVADLPAFKIRSVLPLPPIVNTTANEAFVIADTGLPLYQVDVNPLTNVAVIADTPNGRVVFVPLPH